MGIEAPAEVKYGLIQAAIQADGNLLNITWMCQIAGVSRSGFYAWQRNCAVRLQREQDDEGDFALILEAYRFRGRPKGARGIHMRLLHQGIRMNVKKIRRLMKKYGLKCPIRKENPYKQMAKGLKTNHTFPNVVQRNFFGYGPRKILLTDITYLFYAGEKCYLSTILDAATREVLAYQLSESLEVTFVLETVDQLIKEHGCTLDNTTIIHSDQGCHYTSNAFIQKLQDNQFVQSMSRKGNCWDNAPQESFFGHMKDEIRDAVAYAVSFQAVKEIVDNQIDYYNNDRYQWELLKLSPVEYYQYLTTGVYPLPLYSPKD
ncbi:MAG: IS3 family transposase [Oscillospiraceae bacterium]